MKRYNPIGWQGVGAAVLVALGVLLAPAYCQLPGVALILKQNFAQGGTVIPSLGVHDFAPNSEVTLIATPKPGYYFVCWLGDVADPTSSTTIALLNKPKIIIAVFDRNEYDTLVPGANGSNDIVSSVGGSSGGGFSGGSNYSPPDYNPPSPPDNPPSPPSPPVVPTPEPATGLLLALGTLALLRKHST